MLGKRPEIRIQQTKHTDECLEYIKSYFGENTVSKAVSALIHMAPVILKRSDELLAQKKALRTNHLKIKP